MGKDTTNRLKLLLSGIHDCRLCHETPQWLPGIPHIPRPVLRVSQTARLCVCGQAPGTRVHASGRPFDDPSGDRLRSWMGITRDVFYDENRLAMIPMGFCFPGLDSKGGDLPPRRECALTWHDRLFELLPQIEITLVIGRYAQVYHLRDQCAKNLTDTIRNWRDIYDPTARRRVFPLPHPSWRNTAWLKKNSWFSEEILPVLRHEVASVLDLPYHEEKSREN